jgi:uncharacterized protein YfaS (alpha-2-macroglobulin family)
MAAKKHYYIVFILLAIYSCLFTGVLYAEEPPLSILRINPTGDDVPPARQIVFEFNKPVVPVGRMERKPEEIAIEITPKLNCEWRWINTSSLACQLDEKSALQFATRYSVKVLAGFKAYEGQVLNQEVVHSFITKRPEVNYTWISNWESPVKPNLNVTINPPVTESSLEDHIFLQSSDNKRYALNAEIVKTALNTWALSVRDNLPPDTSFKIMIEPGIMPVTGTEASVESKSLLDFATFGDFKFVGVSCYTKKQSSVEITGVSDAENEDGENEDTHEIIFLAGQHKNTAEKCDPTNSVGLLFSSPINTENLKEKLSIEPDLKGGKADFDPWEYVTEEYYVVTHNEKDATYTQYLPVPLRAQLSYKITAPAGSFKDFFGRSLSAPIDFTFPTDHRPSKFHLNNQISVLEKNVDSHLPLVVTNLSKVTVDYESLTNDGYTASRSKTEDLYKVQDIAYPFPIKIRELLSGKSGVVQGSIKGATKKLKAGTWFFSEVTPYNVHAKLGHFNSLIWVTDFANGMPVANAKVTIYQGNNKNLQENTVLSKTAVTDADGIASLEGMEKIDPELNLLLNWQKDAPRLFVKVEKNDDISILPVSYDFDLSYDSLYPSSKKRFGHIKSWGTTAQGVYKLGDTVQYKIYVRDQDLKTFVKPQSSEYLLSVYDPTGNMVSQRDNIQLNEFGAFDGELELSKTWAVGWYNFYLQPKFSSDKWTPLRVLVSDFTPASFHVTTELEKKTYNINDTAKISSLARLHAGGPYSDGDIRVTAQISTSAPNFEDPKLSGFTFNGGTVYESKELFSKDAKLDDKGDFDTSFKLLEDEIHHGRIIFESAVTDERGKRVASNSSAEYFSRDRFVGIKSEDWLLDTGKPANIKLIVADQNGKISPGTLIKLEMEYEDVKAAKVKSPGNAYLTEYETEWKEAGDCNVTSAEGEVSCPLVPEKPGSYKFRATVSDTNGRDQSVEIQVYAIGQGYVSWKSEASNSIEVIPEKSSYKPGETAKYFIKNPLPGAKALVTIERFGIISSYVKDLKESTAVLEVPVTEDLYPGYYLSIVLMAGRVDKPVENQVDLGKPAFRIGYAKTEVRSSTRELKVNVNSEKPVYKPRDTATLDFVVSGEGLKKEPVEIAVAVLDEAVFDLITDGEGYFDPFKGFYSLDTLDVRNFNLLKQLVGRQKFEKKGANPGGGGGSGVDMRSIFKFVSYWNPSLKTSADGKAQVSFILPDNLTGWRVLAVAINKTDRMGLGQGKFKVNQSIEIRPALPNLVREGDDFKASFTLMNRTETVKTVKANIQAEGVIEQATKSESTITLEPFKRQYISMPLKALRDGEIVLHVSAQDGKDSDAVESKLKVLKSYALETAATYGSSTEQKVTEKFEFPENMRTDVGNVMVTLSPTVISGIDAAYKYMKEYPYACWEQKISKATMAAFYDPLKPYLNKSFSWNESAALVKETLSEAQNFQAPNGGMTFYVPRDEVVSPYLSAYTSLAFTWFSKLGYSVPKDVEEKLDKYLLEYLSKDISPDYYSKGMTTSIRAVALAALATKGKIDSKELMRFEPRLPDMDLFGKAHFLLAASKIDKTEVLQKKITDMIMSSANETGGKYVFGEEVDAVSAWILTSVPRTQCSILSALISSKEKLGDKLNIREDTFFKSLRSISQFRNGKGHWESTQENLYCVNAFVDYSRLFEKQGANYSFEVSLDNKSFGKGKFQNVKSEPQAFERELSSDMPGKKSTVDVEKAGAGRIYYQAALNYAPKELKKEPINSGMTVVRELNVERDNNWELLKSPYKIKQGELVKMDLFITVPAARNFVVVNDPIAGGLEPLNEDLATASKADLSKLEKYQPGSFWFTFDSWQHFSLFLTGFYHKEMRHDSARFYSEYLQAGNYHLSYLAQAIAAGNYVMLPLKAEEMYDPDVFGQGVPETLEVAPSN